MGGTNNETEVTENRIWVTSRSKEEVMRLQGLTDADLAGKSVLSVGEGFSSFIVGCNHDQLCDAWAVDPIYQLIGEDTKYHDFCGWLNEVGYGSGFDEKDFNEIKESVLQGRHLVGSTSDLSMFAEKSIDLMVCNRVASVGANQEETSNFYINIITNDLTEMIRVLKPDGQIRFGDIGIEHRPRVADALKAISEKLGTKYYLDEKDLGPPEGVIQVLVIQPLKD